MKKLFYSIFFAMMIFTSSANAFTASCEVRFSPNGGIAKEVVRYLDAAKSSVDVLAYSYTSDDIGQAIRRAKERGVEVRVIVDRTGPSSVGGEIALDKLAGILTYVDATYRIAHSKVIVIDKINVITGSYNWSLSAEKNNSENILFCKSRIMAKAYKDRFEYLITKAKVY